MSNANLNLSKDYSIVTERELSTILASFETSFVFAAIKDNLAMKYNDCFIGITKPNTVTAFENTFNNLKEVYPMDHDNILAVRQQTYEEIIDILCSEYNLAKGDCYDDIIDKYTLAYYMYDLLVSNFSNHITTFFANYIFREKDAIYNYFNLDQFKKNKDSSTIYGKKAYEDPKLAVISANLVNILQSMQAFDISLYDICSVVYPDPNIVNLFRYNISDLGDFYKQYYCEVLRNQSIVSLFYTSIRLELQRSQL